jgi:hypothetical protein
VLMNAAFDPYASPRPAPAASDLPSDSADLFVATLPSTALRVATGSWIVSGILLLFLAFRLVMAVDATAAGAALEAAHVVFGLLCFAVVWGVGRGGRAWSVLGLFVAPCVGGLSLFALVTGSLAGFFGAGLACLDFVLTAVTMSEVGKIGRAHRALAQAK